jgi:hypothetical protein
VILLCTIIIGGGSVHTVHCVDRIHSIVCQQSAADACANVVAHALLVP